MEIKELPHVINTNLKENSLAESRLLEEIFQDSVIVEHPNHKEFGRILITKSFGLWHLEYAKDDYEVEIKITSTDDNKDIREIIDFVNNHTEQGTQTTTQENTTEPTENK